MDDNALEALKKTREVYHPDGKGITVHESDAPIIGHNIAKWKPCESSWSW